MTEYTVNNVNLTDNQKRVLLMIFTAATPHLAAGNLQGDQHNQVALELLLDLGAVESVEGGYVVTDIGNTMLKDAALVDDMDNLTPDAQQLIGDEDSAGAPPPETPEPTTVDGKELENQSDDLNIEGVVREGWDLIKIANKAKRS